MDLNKKVNYEGYCWIVVIVAIIILISTSLGYLGRYYWFFDLFVNFKVQYLIASFSCGIILLLFAKFAFPTHQKENLPLNNDSNDNHRTTEAAHPKAGPLNPSVGMEIDNTSVHNALSQKQIILFSIFCFIITLLNVIEVFPLYIHSNKTNNRENLSSNSLKIMNCNVLTSNIEYTKLETLVLEKDPDILVFEEVSQLWIDNIPKIKEKYLYSKVYCRDDNFGIAIFSKKRATKADIKFFKPSAIPYIKATFKIANKSFTIFAVHTMPPIGGTRFNERNDMLKDVAEQINQLKGVPVILIGDLNITPWSYFFKKLLKDTNLRNSQNGFGIQPSWPTSPYSLLIPLDHCLISKEFFVENRLVGKDVGSDHYPIFLKLGIINSNL